MQSLNSFKIASLGLLLILVLSCKKEPIPYCNNDCNKKSVAFETILHETSQYYGVKSNLIIQDKETWQQLWNKIYPEGSISPSTPILPEVNFDQYTVIAIFQGEKGSGCTTTIQQINAHCNTVDVSFQEEEPGKNCYTLAVLTYPCHIIKIPKTLQPVNFTSSLKIYDCPIFLLE